MNFSVWKTIKLGILKSVDDFRKAFKSGGCEISGDTNDIIGNPFPITERETEIDLVKISVAELGFKNGARRDQIYNRAKALGLELCPIEAGLQLRLQYKDQPNGETLNMGMEPITDSEGCQGILEVSSVIGDLWLSGSWLDPDELDYEYDADEQWIFCRPRK